MGALRLAPSYVPALASPEAIELLRDEGYDACEIDLRRGSGWTGHSLSGGGELAREAATVPLRGRSAEG